MKWTLGGFSCLGFFVAPAMALPVPVSRFEFRGVPVEQPLRLKVLIKEFDAFSHRGPVVVSGEELADSEGHRVAGSALNCEAKNLQLEILNLRPDRNPYRWFCKSKTYQRFVDERPLLLRAAAGFLQVNEKLFRGSVKLSQEGAQFRVFNLLDLENYVVGVVNFEIRSDYPDEAVKAQVIAARSYALATALDRRRQGRNFDLIGTEMDQVYQGSHREDARSVQLVRQTAGQYLFHGTELLKAYYHSSSGGFSELPSNVWGPSARPTDELAYLARSSPWDADLQNAQWKIQLSPLMGHLFPGVGELREIQVLARSGGKRVQRLRLTGSLGIRELSGAQFRARLGNRWIKSTLFSIRRNKKGWEIEGRGWGHGVGLSQLGAKQMAKAGKSYLDILKHYYPFASVQTLEGLR